MNDHLEAVVFDLDATLINLGEYVDWGAAQKHVCTEYLNHGCNKETVQLNSSQGLFNLLGTMHDSIILSKGLAEACIIQEKIFSIIDRYETDGIKCSLMPGTLEALEWLDSQDITLGICTSNSTNIAISILENLKLKSFFRSIIGRTVGLKLKPYPDQVLACFNMLGVLPESGVMVGDSHNDVLAGKAAGACTIAVPVYFTRINEMDAAKPDLIIKNLHELPLAITKLRNKQ
jgi:phosphoglycolate phosphatase